MPVLLKTPFGIRGNTGKIQSSWKIFQVLYAQDAYTSIIVPIKELKIHCSWQKTSPQKVTSCVKGKKNNEFILKEGHEVFKIKQNLKN